MTTISTHQTHGGSATIYQFPIGGRAGSATSGQRHAEQAKPAAADLAVIDAWYHQVAICDAQQATKQ